MSETDQAGGLIRSRDETIPEEIRYDADALIDCSNIEKFSPFIGCFVYVHVNGDTKIPDITLLRITDPPKGQIDEVCYTAYFDSKTIGKYMLDVEKDEHGNYIPSGCHPVQEIREKNEDDRQPDGKQKNRKPRVSDGIGHRHPIRKRNPPSETKSKKKRKTGTRYERQATQTHDKPHAPRPLAQILDRQGTHHTDRKMDPTDVRMCKSGTSSHYPPNHKKNIYKNHYGKTIKIQRR